MHGSRHLLRSYVARVRVPDVYLRSEESDEEGRGWDTGRGVFGVVSFLSPCSSYTRTVVMFIAQDAHHPHRASARRPEIRPGCSIRGRRSNNASPNG